MKKINKLLFLLTLMLVGFVGINSVKADSNYPEYVKIGSKQLTSLKPYFMVENPDDYNTTTTVESCTLGENGCMAYYDVTKGELILKNYDYYSSIENEVANTDLTIKLVGDNVIRARQNDAAIISNSGNLTIISDTEASLKILFEDGVRENAIGIINENANNSYGSINISGNVSVDIRLAIHSTDNDHEEIGIKNLNGQLNIKDNASLTISASSIVNETDEDINYGLNVNEFNVNTTGTVSIDANNLKKPINGETNFTNFNKVVLSYRYDSSSSNYVHIPNRIVWDYANKFVVDEIPYQNQTKKVTITKEAGKKGIMIHSPSQLKSYMKANSYNVILGENIDNSGAYEDDDITWSLSSTKRILDLNGYTLDLYGLIIKYSADSCSGTFTLKDSSENKTGTINTKYSFSLQEYSPSTSTVNTGCSYELNFEGGNYNYTKTGTIINVDVFKTGKLQINYNSNPIFINNNGVGLFFTNDSNVNMHAESLTYKSSKGKSWANLGTSSDSFYSTKTYGDLINKYTTDAFINDKKIGLSQQFDTALADAVDGENIITIKPIIPPYDITMANVSGIVNKTYNVKGQTQNVKLVYDNKILVKDTDYTVSYKNNKNVGTATIIITGVGDYEGQITKKQGTVTFVKQKGSSTKLAINKTTGKITVKKGTKKGIYKIKVKITANGNKNYKAKSIIKTIKVRVK